MAKHVADTNAVEVPHKTAVALERGIWVRRSFSQKLADSAARRDHRSDATHSHFVEVLEKVRGYLKPIMEAGLFKPEDLDKKTDVKTNHPAKGMFDVLNVYTPSEEFLNAPDITPTPAAELETQYTVEEEVTWEDAFFAFATLLRDYDYLSQEIHSLWEKWASGDLDLAAVALATNTAFEFAHSMESDIKKLIDKFGGTTIFAHQCFEAACEGMGIDKRRISPGAMCNLEAYDVAKILNLNTMGVFNSYVKHSRDAIMPSYNGAFGWYNERLGSEGRNNTERWNQDKTALFEIFPHMHFLTTPPGQGDVEDELIRGMGAALKTKSESNRFWISWALQMYLDIIQRLGPYVGRGFEQFKQESLKIQNALVDLPQTAERKQVLQVATRWNHDPIFEMRQANVEYGMLPHDGEGPSEFHFLRRNPIHCGLLIHHMRSMLHVNGVKTVAPSGGLMTTTQLYQALRQEGRIPKGQVWEDLEEVWEYQGSPCFFIGNPPQDLEGYFKNYCLCSGVSITNWAANRRSTRPTGHKGNAPNIKFDGWVSLRLDDRIQVDNPRKPWTTETVEEILTEGRKRAMMDGKGHIQENLKQKAKEANLPAVPKSPSGLIEQLAQVVNSEIPRISFDYFTMHHIAWSLLTDLKRALTAEVGPGLLNYIPSEDQLPIVVGYVFSTASGHGSADVRERGVGSDRLLDVATDVVAEFLRMGYGSLIKKMRRMEVGPEDVEDVEVDGSELWGPRKFKKEQMDRDGHLGGRANRADVADLMRLLQMGR